MMGFPGNLQDMLQKAQQLQQDFGKIQEELAEREIEASAGGGMITVKVNGKQEIVSLTIEKEVVNPEDIGMLQDLVQAAVNEGMRKSRDMLKEEISKLTGGLPIPGFSL